MKLKKQLKKKYYYNILPRRFIIVSNGFKIYG